MKAIVSRTPRGALAVLLALASWTCASRQPGDPLEPGYNVYSPEQDIEIGRQYSAEIRKQVDVVDNQELQTYVSDLGKRLARAPEAGEYPYAFTLINEPSINAFALPGGPIFVHSGLVAEAETEGQLVGVLAHEIAHVALRHGTSQASRAQMIQLPAILAGAIIGDQSALAQAGQLGLGLGVNAFVMKYSRTAEKEADALGARLMSQAGFNPIEMARFFEKLEEMGGARPPAFLSSHPSPGNRMRLIQAEMETFPAGDYGYSSGKFERSQQLVAQLPPPRTPQGSQRAAAFAEPGAAPPSGAAGGFTELRGRSFSLSHPETWQVYGGQGSDVIAIAPRNGIVRSRGGTQIGLGAVLSSYRPRYRTDLLNATWELVQELQELDPALKVAQGPRQVTAGGAQGLLVGLSGRSPYGGAERTYLLTFNRPRDVFYMVFVAPEQGFGQIEPAFDRMAQSIRFR